MECGLGLPFWIALGPPAKRSRQKACRASGQGRCTPKSGIRYYHAYGSPQFAKPVSFFDSSGYVSFTLRLSMTLQTFLLYVKGQHIAVDPKSVRIGNGLPYSFALRIVGRFEFSKDFGLKNVRTISRISLFYPRLLDVITRPHRFVIYVTRPSAYNSRDNIFKSQPPYI